MAASDQLCPEARLLVRIALSAWLLAGLATIWEVLAMQWPDSPLHFGVLPGPIGQLRGFSFAFGAVSLAGAWLWPRLYGTGRGRYALALLVLGVVVHTGALLVAASKGLVGAQLIDPRPDARWVVYTRALGHGLLLLALADALVRAFRRL